MAQLKDKVQNALDEARILILGAHILLGFQLRAFLEPGFEPLPFVSKALTLGALGLILAAVALLIAPTAYHRIVERGEDTEELLAYTSRVMTFALLPFALALGLDVYVAATKVAGTTLGSLAGVFAAFAALFFWYGLEVVPRGGRAVEGGGNLETTDADAQGADKREEGAKKEDDAASKTKDKIRHVLTEARMVLPGAQALMGFQLIAVLTESFERLPATSKYVHLASLVCIALTVVLLMTPAAYHRIVERGEETEHFHRFAGKIMVIALVPLALGICGGVFVVVRKVLGSTLIAVVSSIVSLAVFYELWFGLTVYRRIQRDHDKPHDKPKPGAPGLFGASQ